MCKCTKRLYMSSRNCWGSEVKTGRYEQLKKDVHASANAAGADREYIGRLSNGERRPVISFNADSDQQLLVVAGEDGDEVDPVLAMPEVIDRIGEINPEIGIKILPFFDIAPDPKELVDDTAETYQGFKENLSEPYELYSGEEIMKVMEDSDSEKISDMYSVNDIKSINEVLIHPEAIALDAELEKRGEFRQKLEAVVDTLYSEIPDRFSYFFFNDESTGTVFYKEPLMFEETVAGRAKPVYTCFDVNPRPQEIVGLERIAQQCDYGLALHQYHDNDFFLLDYDVPEQLPQDMISEARTNGIGVNSLENVRSENFYTHITTEEGRAKITSKPGDLLVDQIQRGYVVTELAGGNWDV